MGPVWRILGSTLALASAASALAQDTSPPQVEEQPVWNPASFTADPQGEPDWFIVEAKPGEQAVCDLAWSYRPDRQIIMRRGTFGRDLTLYLWSAGATVQSTFYLDPVVSVDGKAFKGRGREVTFDPLAKRRTVKGSTMRIRLPISFLDAFAGGQTAVITVNGHSSAPITLKSSAAAAEAFKACKDLPPPTFETVPSKPPAPPPPLTIPPLPDTAPQTRALSARSEQRWMTRIVQNYPSRALIEELEGRVEVALRVGGNGRVTDCRVTGSSGHKVLDEAACKGMMRYARFNPALDASGNPINGTYSTSITYALGSP